MEQMMEMRKNVKFYVNCRNLKRNWMLRTVYGESTISKSNSLKGREDVNNDEIQGAPIIKKMDNKCHTNQGT
jgi:hypothetical protein